MRPCGKFSQLSRNTLALVFRPTDQLPQNSSGYSQTSSDRRYCSYPFRNALHFSARARRSRPLPGCFGLVSSAYGFVDFFPTWACSLNGTLDRALALAGLLRLVANLVILSPGHSFPVLTPPPTCLFSHSYSSLSGSLITAGSPSVDRVQSLSRRPSPPARLLPGPSIENANDRNGRSHRTPTEALAEENQSYLVVPQ